MAFPKDFLWGAATASYQVEGAALEDGRGECIWTRFSHTPGNIMNNDTGDVACDHYHRYADDIQLMQKIGLQACRFSIAWPRVMPQGTGATNPLGLSFYDRLVDGLLQANIQPFVTLYHWDLPQTLQDRGGWVNPDCVKWFVDYADLMSRRLGDRVKNWITLNEPWVIAFLGYWHGIHAPGIKDRNAAYKVAHHLNLAHGAAVPVIRANSARAKVGIALNLTPGYSATNSAEDQRAAHWYDVLNNQWFLDPVFKGSYPAEAAQHLGSVLDGIDLASAQKAAVPIDFLGVNYYSRAILKASSQELFEFVRPEGAVFTAMDWEVFPVGLTQLLLYLKDNYNPPAIYITENGAAFPDPEPKNDLVDDPQRVSYYKTHLAAIETAIAEEAPVKGYIVWGLLDNFEWTYGYSKRFGLVYVDYPTQRRIWKSSAHWYKRAIAANAVVE